MNAMICRVGNVLKRCDGYTVRTATLPEHVKIAFIAAQDSLKAARNNGSITLEHWTNAVIMLKETVFLANED
jgi:histidinol dehydrogenase